MTTATRYVGNWWRYADPEAPGRTLHTSIRTGPNRGCDKIRDVEHGSRFRGIEEDGWIQLIDEEGYLLVVHPEAGQLITKDNPRLWRYADPGAPKKTRGVVLYAGKSRDSSKVKTLPHGELMYGWPEDNWLRLEDGSGFIRIVHDKVGTLLQEQVADSSDKESDNKLAERLMIIFDRFDEDRNGKIDMGELTKLMKILDPRICSAEVELMANEADANKDGLLDIKEFLHWICTSQTVKQVKQMKASFQMMLIEDKFKGDEESIKESFRELWDEATKVGTDTPDGFIDYEQFMEFIDILTHGEAEFSRKRGTDNRYEREGAREWVGRRWNDDIAWYNVKAFGDEAESAAYRRGLLDPDGHSQKGVLLDYSAFISWLRALSQQSVLKWDLLGVMEGQEIDEKVEYVEWKLAANRLD